MKGEIMDKLQFLMNTETILVMAVISALIIALAKGVQLATGVNKRFLPVVDIGLGIPLAFVFFHPEGWLICVLIGVMTGLTSCGLFSGVKNVVQVIKGPKV